MKRINILVAFFICWGILIIASSMLLAVKNRKELLDFSRKIAERKVTIYPVCAPIVDCYGTKIAWTEWQFYLQCSVRRKKDMEKFFKELGIVFEPVHIVEKKCMIQNIPAAKAANAVKLARKYRFRLRKKTVRCLQKLPLTAQNFIGSTFLYYGINGLEAQYNDRMQGIPGIYQIMRGPSGRIEKNSFKIMLPMRSGRELRLQASLLELQCGLFPMEVIK
ncbi:MAG: hypothetical protein IKA22_01115 [Lentisphaeria bacterium]|nr:hypothetical protein [Lentisphaeria bacterium]